tara:strand:+ start:146 stop:373 length:228 start_codon:yes stop_codon:yes gene_type:complete
MNFLRGEKFVVYKIEGVSLMEEKSSKKKLLFLEPLDGRNIEDFTKAIIKQLERHGLKITKKDNEKRKVNGKEKKS